MNSYYKYYSEIKNRFILIIFSWVSLIITCYFYKETLLFILIDLSHYTKNFTIKPYFIFTNVTEIFYVYLELVFFVSNQFMILIILYHILMFLALGLYQFEFTKLKFAFNFFIISWLSSVLLLYKFLIPISWEFFLGFQTNSELTQPISFLFEAKIEEYFHYFKNTYYFCLINCQFLALVTFFLTNLSEPVDKIKTFRKLFYFIFIIFSTITTPPDIFSQILMSSLLMLIYEFLIIVKCLNINKVTN